jgi:hypothetical protein
VQHEELAGAGSDEGAGHQLRCRLELSRQLRLVVAEDDDRLPGRHVHAVRARRVEAARPRLPHGDRERRRGVTGAPDLDGGAQPVQAEDLAHSIGPFWCVRRALAGQRRSGRNPIDWMDTT